MAAKKSKTALPNKNGLGKNPAGSQYAKVAKNLNAKMGKGGFAARKTGKGR